jgi:Predicted NADH:ubiquinone oxidoreductase, subunit RnfE
MPPDVGDSAKDMVIYVMRDYEGFLLAILPPGAFIGLGLLIALKNIIDKRLAKPKTQTVNFSIDPEKA